MGLPVEEVDLPQDRRVHAAHDRGGVRREAPRDARAHRGAAAPAADAVPGVPAPRRVLHAARRWAPWSWATSAATRSARCRRCRRWTRACAWARASAWRTGMELAGGAGERPVVAVLGDSTFAHSGLTGLMNLVYNGAHTTVVILDNRITAMTGHQDNPFTGRTLMGDPAPALDIEAVCRGLGVEHVTRRGPDQPRPDRARAERGLEFDGPSVVVIAQARVPCSSRASAARWRSRSEDVHVVRRCASSSAVPRSRGTRPAVRSSTSTLCVGCAPVRRRCAGIDAIAVAGRACDSG